MRRSLASSINASPSTSLVSTSSTLSFSARPSSDIVFTITLSPPGFTRYFTFNRPFGEAEAGRIKRREKMMEGSSIMLQSVLAGWACVSYCRGLLTLVGPGGARQPEPMLLPIVILLLHTAAEWGSSSRSAACTDFAFYSTQICISSHQISWDDMLKMTDITNIDT